LSGAPGAGTVNADSAEILALRIQWKNY
jgi:hypothetical protein